jgi:hypothetical protein
MSVDLDEVESLRAHISDLEKQLLLAATVKKGIEQVSFQTKPEQRLEIFNFFKIYFSSKQQSSVSNVIAEQAAAMAAKRENRELKKQVNITVMY